MLVLDWIMTNEDIRSAFGVRVKALRKQRKWTQKELAAQLDVSFSLLNKYESGLHVPPPEKIILLADIFNTTIDYLLAGERKEETPLHNRRLLERFRALEDFDDDDKETVIKLIDAMIVKRKVEGAVRAFE
jgi:transcriptional regulator with XRE-family HTH domain